MPVTSRRQQARSTGDAAPAAGCAAEERNRGARKSPLAAARGGAEGAGAGAGQKAGRGAGAGRPSKRAARGAGSAPDQAALDRGLEEATSDLGPDGAREAQRPLPCAPEEQRRAEALPTPSPPGHGLATVCADDELCVDEYQEHSQPDEAVAAAPRPDEGARTGEARYEVDAGGDVAAPRPDERPLPAALGRPEEAPVDPIAAVEAMISSTVSAALWGPREEEPRGYEAGGDDSLIDFEGADLDLSGLDIEAILNDPKPNQGPRTEGAPREVEAGIDVATLRPTAKATPRPAASLTKRAPAPMEKSQKRNQLTLNLPDESNELWELWEDDSWRIMDVYEAPRDYYPGLDDAFS